MSLLTFSVSGIIGIHNQCNHMECSSGYSANCRYSQREETHRHSRGKYAKEII